MPTSYSLTPSSTSVSEAVGTITFTITRSGDLPAETIFASTTTNQGSSNSGDYTGIANQSIAFSSGQTSRTFTVSITNDTAVESNETFGVIVQRNASDPITTFLDSSTFTIQDNDTAATTYSLTPSSTTVDEAAGTITFTVTRSGGLPAETIFASTTTNQGSSNSGDYTGIANQSLAFSSGQTSRTFTVSITNDTSVESNETFGVIIQRNASDPITTFLDSSTFTIQDNDTAATTYSLTPSSTTVDEAAGTITFTVTRSGGLPAETIFASTTTNQGSSNSGDYTGIANQSIAFSSGQTSRTFTVSITNDTAVESNETFGVIIQRNASDPITTFLDSSTFTIQDNDFAATTYSLTPSATTVDEAGGTITFTVTRSGTLSAETIFASTTTNQGSSNSGDYTGIANQSLTFSSGQTSATFTVSITNDTAVELNETFGVIIQRNASDPITTFLDSSTFTIQDNDSAATTYSLTPSATTVDEAAGTITFTVTRSGTLSAETIFASTTTNQGSSNSGDYTGIANQSIAFTAGQTSRTFTVSVTNDTAMESNETFGVIIQRNASDPVTTFLDSSTFTIQDNDGAAATAYAITPGSAIANENAGTITFTVTRSGPLPAETVFASTTQNQGSSNNGDYTGVANQSINFAAGATSAIVTVAISNDSTAESNETFGLIVQRNAADPIGTRLASATFTIQDNDGGTTYSVNPSQAPVNEADGTVSFTIFRSGALAAETVYVSTTQTEGSLNNGDYVGIVNRAITFAAGQTQSTQIAVAIANDGVTESSESFGLVVQRNASDPVSAHLAIGTFTIADNDAGVSPISVSLGPDVQVNENQDAVLTISLASPTTQTVSVQFATYFGTASAAGNDYDGVLGQLVIFNPGEQHQTIQIAINDDGLLETTEFFEIRLSNPQGVSIADGQATVTIVDNDAAQSIVTPNTSLEFMLLLSAAAYQPTPNTAVTQGGFRVLGDADLSGAASLISANGLFENANAQGFAGVIGDTLYVAFRGTDEDADRDQWLDKSAHYQLFSQFIEALRVYSSQHPEIRHVMVTGHSLGGAMAQHFVTNNSWLPDPHAVTFANPGFGTPIPSHVSDARIINVFVDGDIIRQAAYVGQIVGTDIIVHDTVLGLDADSIDFHEVALYAAVVQQIGVNNLAGSMRQIAQGRDVNLYFDISRNLTSGAWSVTQPSAASIVLAQAMDQIFTTTSLDEWVDLTWAGSNFLGRGIYNLAPTQFDAIVDLIGGFIPGGLSDGATERLSLQQLEIPTTGAYAVGAGIGVDRLVGVVSVIGGAGNDQISGDDLANILIGNAGNDLLVGRNGDDWLIGGTGGDTLNGGGADVLAGETDDDQYVVDNAADVVNELPGEGHDTVYTFITYTLTADVEDLATATAAAINLFGNSLANLIVGNGAVNGIDGGAGLDTMIGAGGNDLYFVDNIADVVIEGAGEGTADVVYTSLAFYQLGDNVEQLSVTAAGGTYALGNGANNLVVGNSGADALDGGAGIDTLIGGAGNDSYFVDNIADVIIEGASEGAADVVYTGLAFFQLGDNVEQLSINTSAGTYAVGNNLSNLIVGNSGADALDGGAGVDTLIGGAGNDSYFVDNVADVIIEGASEGAADVVYTSLAFYALGDNVEQLSVTTASGTYAAGNSVDNLIVGNAGADALEGRLGSDVLVGNGGADSFIYNTASEGGDAITDFVSGVDVIRIDASGFGGGLVAGSPVTFFSGSNPVAGAGAAFLYDTDDGRLFWDADGAGGAAATLIATLSGAPTLVQGDIIVGP